MADEINARDANHVPTISGILDDATEDVTVGRFDPTTKRFKVNTQALDSDVDSVVIGGAGTIADNRKVVTTAGVSERLVGSATPCKRLEIAALPSNTDIVVVGGSTVVAAAGSERGKILYPGDGVMIDINDVEKIYIDSRVSGEGISFMYTV